MEFFTTPTGEIMYSHGKAVQIVAQDDKDIINDLLLKVENDYPEAYNRLDHLYKHSWESRWLMFRRFVSCNFGTLDNTADKDENNTFHFEQVNCPIRCECQDCSIICNPQFNSCLTKRERQIVAMICSNMSDNDIANELYLSLNTIKNHRVNILRKLNVHNKQGISDYARKNNLL